MFSQIAAPLVFSTTQTASIYVLKTQSPASDNPSISNSGPFQAALSGAIAGLSQATILNFLRHTTTHLHLFPELPILRPQTLPNNLPLPPPINSSSKDHIKLFKLQSNIAASTHSIRKHRNSTLAKSPFMGLAGRGVVGGMAFATVFEGLLAIAQKSGEVGVADTLLAGGVAALTHFAAVYPLSSGLVNFDAAAVRSVLGSALYGGLVMAAVRVGAGFVLRDADLRTSLLTRATK
ncbi:hypothetical protein HK096_006593 [Nowakowskiella sp. JEL0078]|nr:hypothetical protein HK096_006593 [Nowakowskiella sp. JEL0078]